MRRGEKALCILYAVIAIVALFATWSNNIAYLLETGTLNFWHLYEALYVNYATASFINDLFALGFAACVFILVEGWRLKIRFFWAYVLFSGPIAISVTFPLFMIARQMVIAKNRTEGIASQVDI